MKIIKVDSYNRETYSDVLIAENVHAGYGKIIVDLLNNNARRSDSDFFKLVDDNYKLFEFKP
jgi:molybdate-binding protein